MTAYCLSGPCGTIRNKGTRGTTIVLEPQTETLLRDKAEREDQDLNTLANVMLGTVLNWEVQDRSEAAEGVQRGLDDFAAGRHSSASQVFADIKAKHSADEI